MSAPGTRTATHAKADSDLSNFDMDAIAGGLVFGRSELLADLFAKHRTRAPLILWSPAEHEIPEPIVCDFSRTAQRMARDGACIRDTDLDISAFSGMQRWMMILEVLEAGSDFRYTHYGASIAEAFGTSMAGRRTSEFGGHISRFFTAVYKAAMIRREQVYSEHEPPGPVFVSAWRRLIVPVTDASGEVSRFLAINRAVNPLRAGLKVVPAPCLAATATGRVLYANPHAQRLFSRHGNLTQGTTLGDLIGRDVMPDIDALTLIDAANPLRRRMAINEMDGTTTIKTATIGAARHGNSAIFVVTIE